ncbi:upstream stimulatory factor 2 [Cephus cinctus]|uniref:Upstream stimulatory factor 2 n=1 Tax=Cephus cinctus TaxID=211228 RepID=A0AAJ7FSK8_CEPCN|nr:upstream stimulatory factor 2 [Cephus cinctus]
MDILEHHLDPLGESTEENTEENVGIVLEEAEVVDCDGDGDGIAEEGLRYQLAEAARSEGLAYRVVQVNDNESGEIELPLAQPVNSSVQVLSSPLNGQFYVISNGNEVFTTQTARSLSPRVTTLQLETPHNATSGIKKRDERRRVTHNEVERRRRDKINNWISKLGKLLPECNNTVTGEGEGKPNFESQSKGGILARACEYIVELREANESLGQGLRENERLIQEAKSLRQLASQLRRENSQLKAQIAPTSDFILGS